MIPTDELKDAWTADGRIDAIKFSKIMSKLKGTSEKDEFKDLMDYLGVKYTDLSQDPLGSLV